MTPRQYKQWKNTRMLIDEAYNRYCIGIAPYLNQFNSGEMSLDRYILLSDNLWRIYEQKIGIPTEDTNKESGF